MTSLPTWPEIVRASLSHLDAARRELGDVRDWLASDWSPVDTSLTYEAAEARAQVQRLVREIKGSIDEAKDYLQRENADRVERINHCESSADTAGRCMCRCEWCEDNHREGGYGKGPRKRLPATTHRTYE